MLLVLESPLANSVPKFLLSDKMIYMDSVAWTFFFFIDGQLYKTFIQMKVFYFQVSSIIWLFIQ